MKRLISVFLVSFFAFVVFNSFFPSQLFAQHEEKYTSWAQDELTEAKKMHHLLWEAKQRKWAESRIYAPQKPTATQNDYDALYYGLDLDIDHISQIIYGKVDMEAKTMVSSLDSAQVDLYDNMTVDSVKTGDTYLTYTHQNDLLTIDLDRSYAQDERFLVTIFYHGHPVEGGLQAFSFGTHGGGIPTMSSLSEPYFARTWWPCKDAPHDKADSADIIITVDSSLIVASNGVLREVVDNLDGTKTYKWHESYPITTYLISVAITNYQTWTEYYHYSPSDSMPVTYWVYPEYYDDAVAGYAVTVPAIEIFADLFGEYPFVNEKYGMAHFNWGGGMEHQTCTSMLSYYYSSWIIVHELAHQWWGDMITCRDWHHIWLNEGFASYSEALYFEQRYGSYYYHNYMMGMDYTGGGTIYVQDTADVGAIFGTIVYDKGAWVLHMLRRVVGDSTFFDILQAYYQDPRYQYGAAVTEDFQGVCEDVYGSDLSWFFQEWIYGTYRPNYHYSFAFADSAGDYKKAYLHVEQTQSTPPWIFTMPLDILIRRVEGDTLFVVFNDDRIQDFEFTVRGTPTNLFLDPYDWILKYYSVVDFGPFIATSTLPDAEKCLYLSDTLNVLGGTPPFSFQKTGGDLPLGINLDPDSGVIYGAALEEGLFTFTIEVTDSDSPPKSHTKDISLNVGPCTIALGDADNNGDIDYVDILYVIEYVFREGPQPIPYLAGDADSNGDVDYVDILFLIDFIFRQGPAPCS